MSKKKNGFWLDYPPVWELGLVVQTQASGVVDNYEIAKVHDLFRTKLPTVSRHGVIDLVGTPGIQEVDVADPIFRWWFSNPEGPDLVQLQENLIGWNWRRGALPPAMPHQYPGFDNAKNALKAAVDAVAGYQSSRGNLFPEPIAAELLYDNFISLTREDGSTAPLCEVFTTLHRPFSPSMTSFSMKWEEDIPDAGDGALLKVQAASLAIVGESEPMPALRLTLSARGKPTSWDEAYGFMTKANGYVRNRFRALTSEHCHTLWGMK